ncbi:MAG: TraX protein [Oscillospiraceae bacterium]|nr:TraX protein [Oscillospiraceae bacterium]
MQETHSLNKCRILSGSALKLIAVITMFIDHVGYSLCYTAPFFTAPLFTVLGETVTVYYILRKIGRLAFPIYCFLIGEGLFHTRNQIRYLLRLLSFAILSEVPFNLMIGGSILCPENQNVFFTLFLGALSICFFQNINNRFLQAFLMLAVLWASTMLDADYGTAGVVVILLIYVLRDYPIVQAIAGYPLFSGGMYAIAAFIPINMYNGKRGFIKSPILKYAFYLFYPLHMLLLWWIRRLLT